VSALTTDPQPPDDGRSSGVAGAVAETVAGATAAVAALLDKPRLRGWLHVWAFAVSIAAGVTLIAVAGATRGTQAGLATAGYALTTTLLFGTSALYHRRCWSPRWHDVMARLDHSMIFVFIAGTYTPFALLAMPPDTGEVVFLVVWLGALAGVALKTAWIGAPRWVGVPLYLGLGWIAVFVFPGILHHGGVAVLVLLAVGGVVYSLGGVVYALRRPDPVPHVFGFHEVFHLCTVVAGICHYVAVWLAVYSG
jgi:hemolysin III